MVAILDSLHGYVLSQVWDTTSQFDFIYLDLVNTLLNINFIVLDLVNTLKQGFVTQQKKKLVNLGFRNPKVEGLRLVFGSADAQVECRQRRVGFLSGAKKYSETLKLLPIIVFLLSLYYDHATDVRLVSTVSLRGPKNMQKRILCQKTREILLFEKITKSPQIPNRAPHPACPKSPRYRSQCRSQLPRRRASL